MKVTWNGKEVQHPALRFLVQLWAITLVVLGMAVMLAFIAVVTLTCPIWVPLDLILKHYERHGFIIHNPDGTITLSFTPKAFLR